jgi:uncharacterized protein (TIGR00299 family) protein
MFAAALLDARPSLQPALQSMAETSGLDRHVELRVEVARSRGLAGRRMRVSPRQHEGHHHRHYAEVRELVGGLVLDDDVAGRALAILALVARAEARVHDVPEDDVAFHEVGAWDSIADVVVAAWLVEQLAGASWSCAPLPLGSGRVPTAHGPLPVPAPATALLLEGLPVVEDGVAGERVTPTGAAIVRHLQPALAPPAVPLRIGASGIGCGTRELDGMSNVLRVLMLDEADPVWTPERIAVLEFEVDDQAPEDLATGVESLRAARGVVDVTQCPVQGKKGRLAVQVRVLAEPGELERVIEQCFVETTTLGVRWHVAGRAALGREVHAHDVDGHSVRVKRTRRPGAVITAKAEMDDVARAALGRDGRERLRRAAENHGKAQP